MIRYSPSELRLEALLPNNGGKITISKLISAYYGRRPPRNAQRALNGYLRSLATKVKKDKRNIVVRQSPRRGPHETEWWIEHK